MPFSLIDSLENSLNIKFVNKAEEFQPILEMVWQDETRPESRSIGDFATNMVLNEIPYGTLTKEYLLVFGSTLGAHGVATLQNRSGTITLVPTEVSTSINGLIAHKKKNVNTLRFIIVFLLISGVFSLIAVVVYLYYNR